MDDKEVGKITGKAKKRRNPFSLILSYPLAVAAGDFSVGLTSLSNITIKTGLPSIHPVFLFLAWMVLIRLSSLQETKFPAAIGKSITSFSIVFI
ncbi:MAG: hypothetical protein FWF52_05745 [Candidatus Azobacteroides sp.]|nr:hypothetical protein [Candidatus Azobacteroides sp.]